MLLHLRLIVPSHGTLCVERGEGVSVGVVMGRRRCGHWKVGVRGRGNLGHFTYTKYVLIKWLVYLILSVLIHSVLPPKALRIVLL
jgi:hypothetical protein